MVTTLDPIRANELVRYLFINDKNVEINFNITGKRVTAVSLSDSTKGLDISKLIKSEISKRYPNVEIDETTDGGVIKLKAISPGSSGIIYIDTVKEKKSPILQPGKAYEEYFHSFIVDGTTKRKEIKDALNISTSELDRRFKLYLMLYADRKKIEIGPIRSTSKIGDKNKKTDEKITLTSGKTINISLKQVNFWWWSGGATKDEIYSKRPKEILNKAIQSGLVTVGSNNDIIFPQNINGIRVQATLDEVKKYVFSEGSDKIDYVVINSGVPKLRYEGNGNLVISTQGVDLFKNGDSGHLNEIQRNVYMIIYKKNGAVASALTPYINVSIMFVTKKYAYVGKYLDITL